MSVMALSLARYVLYTFLTLPLEKSGANIAGRCEYTSSCIYYLSAKLYALSDALPLKWYRPIACVSAIVCALPMASHCSAGFARKIFAPER